MHFALKLAAVAFAASVAVAQGPGPGGPRIRQMDFSELKTFLSLTDAQVTQLQQAQQQLHTNNRTIFEQLAAKQKSLRETLESGTTDAAAVGKLMLEIEALRKQLKASRENAVTAAVASLTGAQRAKLAELEAASKLGPSIGQAHILNLLAPAERDVLIMGPGPHMGLHFEEAPVSFGIGAAAAEPIVMKRVEIRR